MARSFTHVSIGRNQEKLFQYTSPARQKGNGEKVKTRHDRDDTDQNNIHSDRCMYFIEIVVLDNSGLKGALLA
jgi:hypothetical protein